MKDIDKEALQNEEDFLNARIQVLRGKPQHSLRLIAERKGITMPIEETDSYELAVWLAHAEAEKIGLLPARPQNHTLIDGELAEEPGPLVREQYGLIEQERQDALGHNNHHNLNIGVPFEDTEKVVAGLREAFTGYMAAALPEDDDGAPLPGRNLPQEIMAGWIGAIGGMDWYNGSQSFDGELTRSHGKALAATLDAVFDGLPLSMRATPYDIRTTSGWFIYEDILPELLTHFFAKNADYGDHHRDSEFGTPGEYIGLHRKITKLKAALWDGQVMNGESAKEMLFDVVGQCFIILDLLAAEESVQP